jgi:hypothetical protein
MMVQHADMLLDTKENSTAYLAEARRDMAERLHTHRSVGFIAGGDDLAEKKRELELGVLDALLAFINARKKQRDELPKLSGQPQPARPRVTCRWQGGLDGQRSRVR